MTRAAPPTVTGRWFAFDARVTDPTVETHGLCEQLLERYGVVTKGAVMTEEILGGFARIYRGLSGFEDTGRVRRGYFVDGLGGAQFAAVSTVDALREHAGDVTDDRTGGPGQAAGGEEPQGVVVASCDPANPYGATLPWPETEGHRPGRKPGALVVLVDGRLALFVERGGKTVLTFSTDDLPAAATALAETVRAGRVDRVQIERVDGENVLGTPVATVFTEAGFTATPRGIRLRHMAR